MGIGRVAVDIGAVAVDIGRVAVDTGAIVVDIGAVVVDLCSVAVDNVETGFQGKVVVSETGTGSREFATLIFNCATLIF